MPKIREAILLRKNRHLWMFLAFQGGLVNVGGLLTIHLFVSHVTGFSAHFSLAITQQNFLKALYFFLVPFFFLVGAIFSALFTEIKKNKGKVPTYSQVMGLLSLIYCCVAFLGAQGVFGNFGEELQNFRDFVLLTLLAFCCGAQNALFTHYSNSIIRTTHLTGLTTDLGIGIAKYFFSKDLSEAALNQIRIALISSFILGSVFGAIVFPILQFWGFGLSSLISAYTGIRLYYSSLPTKKI